jgi:high-affinity iron transporter
MLAAALLAFREGLEAALILGIMLSVLHRVNQGNRAWAVWLGAGLAGLISIGIGLSLHAIGVTLEGKAEEIFEGVAMLLAAAVLTWMIFWMRSQGRNLQGEVERNVHRAAWRGGMWALFSLAFVAVLREGVELALFLTAAAFSATATVTLIGGLAGLASAAVIGWLLFATTVRLDVRTYFRVTSILLIVVAAGLVAHGVHELNEAGWIPPVVDHIWDTNPVLDENSDTGQLLNVLVGYNGNPSLTEAVAYIGYWVIILLTLWRIRLKTDRSQSLAHTA